MGLEIRAGWQKVTREGGGDKLAGDQKGLSLRGGLGGRPENAGA